MEIKTVRTKEDILEFNLRVVKKSVLIMLCFSIFILAFGIIEVIANLKKGEIYYGTFLIAFGILFTPIYYVILISSLKKNINKNPLMVVDWNITYNFTENEITVVSESVAGSTQNERLKWPFITKCAETKNLIIIYAGNHTGYLINKKTVSVQQVNEVKQLLLSRLGNKICSFKN